LHNYYERRTIFFESARRYLFIKYFAINLSVRNFPGGF
jgi:hypothetical protein